MAKSGYNTNLASEFYVLSHLYRLGVDANLTLGNKKAVDIVVVRSAGDALTIDVKAVAQKVDWPVGNVNSEPRLNHFIVLLSYEGHFSDLAFSPRAWVFPHREFVQLIKSAKAPSTMRYVSRKDVLATSRESAWDLVCTPASRLERECLHVDPNVEAELANERLKGEAQFWVSD